MALIGTPIKRVLMSGAAFALLTACDEPFDFDFRDVGNGFDTSQAVRELPGRPRPDDRGVISYPNYQVVVAQRDDTVRTIAGRLGLNANELARYNGVSPDVTLRRDEVIALPNRVAEPSPATGAVGTGPIQPLDVTAVATSALDRAGPQAPVTTTALEPTTPSPVTPTASPTAAPAPVVVDATTPRGTEPIRHQVVRGETVFSISRLYNVPVRNIAEWNGLNSEMTIREGQFLLVPQGAGAEPITDVAAPGSGSETPVPPSAATPLPDVAATPVTAPAAPDIGTPTPAPASNAGARLMTPVQGTIIRAYAPGRNEGIDISAPAGTAVKAADAGKVAAVTTDTNGNAIVVITHSDGLLTVYTGIDSLSVSKNDNVSRGQSIGKVKSGDPSFLHFEVRRGLQSVDPDDFLP